jgi:hypothetical protein
VRDGGGGNPPILLSLPAHTRSTRGTTVRLKTNSHLFSLFLDPEATSSSLPLTTAIKHGQLRWALLSKSVASMTARYSMKICR